MAGSGQWRANVADVAQPAQSGDEVVHGGDERRIADPHAWAGLYEHLLDRVLRERVRDDLGRLTGLAVPHLGVGQVALANRATHEERDQDERQPADDGSTAMAGTPPRRARSDGRPAGLRARHDELLSAPELFAQCSAARAAAHP